MDSNNTNPGNEASTETKSLVVKENEASELDELTIINELIIDEEYASLVPQISQPEYQSIKQSIKDNGQWVPIIVNPQRIILDGHTRFRACKDLRLEPKVMIRKFESSLLEMQFIIQINRNRRHLSPFQRIELQYKYEMIEADLAKNRVYDAGKIGADKRWNNKEKAGDDRVVQKDTTPSEVNQEKIEEKSNGKGRVIDLAAQKAHVSPMTYYKGREIIRQIQSEEELNKLRRGDIKIDKVYKQLENRRKIQHLLSSASSSNVQLPDNIKLIEGDFIEKCKDIPAQSVALIFTDPPYALEFLPIYKDLAKVASILLKDGASLVTYCGQNLKYKIIQIMEAAGLTYWWEIAIIQAGSSARIFNKKVVVTWKPLLWFVKGIKLRTTDYIRDSVQSSYPDKTYHNWTQSTVEAEHVISRLTIENDVILDPMMGTATTGIASLNLKRQFMGIEKDAETFKIAKVRLGKYLSDDTAGKKTYSVQQDG